MLRLVLAAVIDEADALVNAGEPDSATVRNSGAPFRRIVADEAVAASDASGLSEAY